MLLLNKAILHRTLGNKKYRQYWNPWVPFSMIPGHSTCDLVGIYPNLWGRMNVGTVFYPCIPVRRPHAYPQWSQVSDPSPQHEAGPLYRQHRSQPGCSSSPAPSQGHPQWEWSLAPLSSQNLHDIWPEKEKKSIINSNWNSSLSHKIFARIPQKQCQKPNTNNFIFLNTINSIFFKWYGNLYISKL